MKTLLWIAVILSSAVGGCASRRASERARADLAAGAMVLIPGGSYRLHTGSGPFNELPTYVSVDSFLIDATEVTVAQYSECVRAGRCDKPAETVDWQGIGRRDRERWSPFCNGSRDDRAEHPVNCVDWNDAKAFCEWAGKRLPSEEEWEWAARNGKEATRFPWGDEPPGDRPCWSGEGAGEASGTCPAGSRPGDVTAAGVKDLGGNVAEWTTSRTIVGADSRGRGGTTVMVYRGGSWADTAPEQVAVAARSADLRPRRDAQLGFRCASAP